MSSLIASQIRNRTRYAFAFTIVILLGLASRHHPNAIPVLFGKYPGDALWAMMVFIGWGFLFPRASTLSIAALAFFTCFVIEILKLYQSPWIVDIRQTTIGYLVFGHVFSIKNLLAYAVGIVIAFNVEISSGRSCEQPSVERDS